MSAITNDGALNDKLARWEPRCRGQVGLNRPLVRYIYLAINFLEYSTSPNFVKFRFSRLVDADLWCF